MPSWSSWIFGHKGISCIALLLLYGVLGFAMLVGAAIGDLCRVLRACPRACRGEELGRADQRRHRAVAWALLSGTCGSSANCCGINISSRTADLVARWQERQELRRLYREEYAQDFPSYRAFLRYWRALQAAEQAKTDPLQQAIRLMGLPEQLHQGRSQAALPHPDCRHPPGPGRPERTGGATDRRQHPYLRTEEVEMTNFLTRRNRQEPTAAPTPAETRQEAFANAVAAFRQATGKAETRVIPCRCAVTGEPFAILFERMSPAHRFQIARIERNEATGNDKQKPDGGVFGRKPQQQSYDAGEFDWTGCVCPHCGNRVRRRLLQRLRRNRLRRPGPSVAGRKQGLRLS